MNKTAYGFLFAAMTACSGCISSHLTWVEGFEPEVPETVSANCRFAGNKGPAAAAAAILNAAANPNAEAIDVSVFLEKGEAKPANGLLAKVNNIFSFFTLGVWPWVRSQERDCWVELAAHGEKAKREFVLGHRVWSSFILPIGLIPCPGWSDWRSSATFSLDFEQAPRQKGWEAGLVAGYANELLTAESQERFKQRRELMHNPPTASKSDGK